MNSFGDEQLAVDMLADKLLFEALRFSVSGGGGGKLGTGGGSCVGGCALVM